jgi:phasin
MMADMDQGKRAAQKGAAMARDGIERSTRAAEQSAREVQRGFTATLDNVRDVQRKMIDIAQEHVEATFDLARQATSASSPADLLQLWGSYARKQFEMLSNQSRELTELSQNLASEAAHPMKQAASQFTNPS